MLKSLRAAITCGIAAVMAFSLAGCASTGYTPSLKNAEVTPPTIKEAGTLRVGVNTSKSPLAGMGNSKIIGIDVDIAAAIADYLGLKVQIIDVGSDAESAISDDKVDIVMGIDNSDTSSDMWLSSEYLQTGVALFALESSSAQVPTESSNPKIAAQVSSKSAWAVTNEFGESALVSASDLSSALGDLSSGSAKYLASDAVIGMYAANRQGVDVEIVALMDNASGYCIGVAKTNSALQNSITSTLSTLQSNGVIEVIENKWLGSALNLSSTPKTDGAKSATTTHIPSSEYRDGGNTADDEEADSDEDADDSDL